MTHTYNIAGMTCSNCQAKVQQLLTQVAGVTKVEVNLINADATVQMEKHIATGTLQNALKDFPKYQLSEKETTQPAVDEFNIESEKKPWIATYKPVLLIFGYIIAISLLIENLNGAFVLMRWMNNFMAGFFLVFSFFKLLNLKGFAESYSMYDVIAKHWNGWGYVYAFAELALGVAFITGFYPLLTNAFTLFLMVLSIIGVLQSVLNKRKIKCACLGEVFNLPMSTITIIEDALMIVMSGIMVLKML
ncbi:heavy-metal-associated domain-containing protein [Ferruginibacter sp.]